MKFKNILVTGAAGFIGYHLSLCLLEQGRTVTGIDNLNDYYDVNLKKGRLRQLKSKRCFVFQKLDLADRDRMSALFRDNTFDVVINLAAQAGVRYSLINPSAYIDSNIVGFGNILEGCRHSGIKHLVFASSSSVYGANTRMPFSVHDNVDHPVSLYAASKKSNELMAHAYCHLYGLPCTGLRFFTVYGPWGRPDMAYFLFADAIVAGKPIQVFNHGNMQRDFTYIDDVIAAVMSIIEKPATPNNEWSGDKPDPGTSYVPYRVYNIGNNQPVGLLAFIETIEKAFGKEAVKEFADLQPGDVPVTFANVDDLVRDVGFKPNTPLEVGIGKFVEWYREYYGA